MATTRMYVTDFPLNLAIILLDMTKKDMLALLGTVNSMQAGAAISFVNSLADNDPRFEMSFEGKAKTAIGYWQREENARLSEFSPSKKCLSPLPCW